MGKRIDERRAGMCVQFCVQLRPTKLRRVLIAMIADIEPAGIEAFRTYEERVLALLLRHGGRLQRRLRTADGTTEIHLVSFTEQAGYDAYMVDPERVQARAVLSDVKLEQRVLSVEDVEVFPHGS